LVRLFHAFPFHSPSLLLSSNRTFLFGVVYRGVETKLEGITALFTTTPWHVQQHQLSFLNLPTELTHTLI